ncbi:MAG: hypothetical protein RLZZ308_290 [Candidatus Parcubacteria bacterium]
MFVIFVLYITLHSNESSMGVDNRYLNPALRILDKRNLIVDFQTLREKLTTTYEHRDDFLISIYFEYLPTGASIAINKDERMWPASLIKIPVAMTAMKKVQEGDWKLSNELVILEEDKDSDYGELYKKPNGTTIAIENLLKESLINSDNTAHFILLRNLENAELEDVYVHLGMDDVIEALKRNKKDKEVDNRITAKRYSIFFRSLYNATFLDQKHSELFMDILEQAPNDLLSTGIPSDVPFVHKTGIRLDEKVMADSGIVYVSGRPYILTVMIQQKNGDEFKRKEIEQLFKVIGEEVYHYVARPY